MTCQGRQALPPGAGARLSQQELVLQLRPLLLKRFKDRLAVFAGPAERG